MSAKKKKFKLSKKQRKQLSIIAKPAALGLIAFVLGIVLTTFLASRTAPTNLVWAADQTVSVPKDLRKFLAAKTDCQHYRGTNSPTGVGLWGVYQTSKGQYAKIAYGCSWNLSSYIMAVKQKGTWQLLPTNEYFAPFQGATDSTKGALPFCTMTDKYKIPQDIEPFCVQADGAARANAQK